MKEDSLFYIGVNELCNPAVYTCAPDDSIQTAAQIMKEKNVSGIIIADNEVPLGVITDRDFRNKVVSANRNPAEIQAREIMSSPLITVRENDYVFEAVYMMSKHNIHRLAVVDEMGRLAGVITDTDIIKHHTNTPLYFIRDLEYANTIEDIKRLDKKVTSLIKYLTDSGVKTREVVRFISHLNDSIILKLIEIIKKEDYAVLPHSFAFLVLGSEGRMEQTLKTDQDNAIVYSDELQEGDLKVLEDFSTKLVNALIYIGVPECPGGIMAKNPFWRRSLSDWRNMMNQWITAPIPENILNYSMFSDLRTIYGDPELEKKLKKQIKRLVDENALFLAHMAKSIMRFPPPLGFFGRIKTETSGENRGKMDIKKGGIFPISEGIKVISLEAGIMGGSTMDKIKSLMGLNIISHDELLELQTSYSFFVHLRLKNQLQQISQGKKPDNFIDPKSLNGIERERLKIGFYVVKRFQDFLREKYKLNFIS